MAFSYDWDSKTALEVNAETYSTKYRKLHPQLLAFHREQSWQSGTCEIDAFGRFWSLAVVDLPKGELGVMRKGKRVEIAGPQGIFIPPHSVIEWSIQANAIVWEAFVSDIKVPEDLPKEPVCFSWPQGVVPYRPQDIFRLVRSAQNWTPIGKEEHLTAVAERTKTLIDEGFSEQVPIAKIADELGYAHAAMTRSFKGCYGLTPVAYRNKMRIFDSQGLMMMYGQPVNRAARAVGYEDVSQYNRQFRRQSKTVPSQYAMS